MRLIYRSIFIISTTFCLSCENKSAVRKTHQVESGTQNAVKTSSNKIADPSFELTEEFYEAIFKNNTEKVKDMIKTSFPAHYQPKNKISPLKAVIMNADNLQLAKLFIDGGADYDDKKDPAVVSAAEYKRLEILKYLIKKGADSKHNTAFNTAGFSHFYDGARYLLLQGANQKEGDVRGKLWVFHQAVRLSDYEVLNALALNKDEWDYNTYDGETALIIAVKNNDIELVKYLIKKGVNRNKPETFDGGDDISYGKLPIEIAKEKHHTEIIGLLQ